MVLATAVGGKRTTSTAPYCEGITKALKLHHKPRQNSRKKQFNI